MPEKDVACLAGFDEPDKIEAKPFPPFDGEVTAFLEEWSAALRSDPEAAGYPDIMSLAFFCRRGNTGRLKKNYEDGRLRIGRGLVFHIAPSNVPVNFAYSLVFGLLAGNGNIVRAPSGPFPQTGILCRLLDTCLKRHEALYRQNAVVAYDRTSDATMRFSARCQMRVIWGGDETITQIRRFPLAPRAGEITFADRYSLALLDSGAVAGLEEEALAQLAKDFYNDTYLMDQNACSSPHLILWRGEGKREEKERFWRAVCREAARYDLEDIKVSDKFTALCSRLMSLGGAARVRTYGNLLYVVELSALFPPIEDMRGRFGCFYEHTVTDAALEELAAGLGGKVQTVTCFGLDAGWLGRLFVQNHAMGADRIVPVGKALDIGLVWDGQDMIYSLSREIVCMRGKNKWKG